MAGSSGEVRVLVEVDGETVAAVEVASSVTVTRTATGTVVIKLVLPDK